MNQITTRYITEGDACYEQYVISDPAAKTELVITPERGGMITGFTLDGDEYIWTRRPNFSECSRPRFGVPVLFPMTFTDKGNGHKVTVDADETFGNGVLWQQDAENFVCMEPWNGWANSVNEEGRHEVLEPDEAMTSEWSITIEKV